MELIPATECPYDLEGRNRLKDIREQQVAFEDDVSQYHAKIAAFNGVQKERKRAKRPLLTAAAYLDFLGLS
ncbi:MAG: hypothetical protein QM784_01885 [Polyangiaceae bacterium]